MRREQLVKLFENCNGCQALTKLHSVTLKVGLHHDSFFATKLSSLYGKHSDIEQARKMFDETPIRTNYLWNAILRGYCRENRWEDTLFLFHDMMSQGMETPDNFTIPIILKACAGFQALRYGKLVHGLVKKIQKIDTDMFVGSAMIELYSKCGQMDDAVKVFGEFPQPDVVLWTSMVTGYEQNGRPEEAVEFFSQMVTVERVDPNPVTLTSLVSACVQLSSFKLGTSIHGFMTRRGLKNDLSLVNSLLNLYTKTGLVKSATNLFEMMATKDFISWSSMIACYAQNGFPVEALELFSEMVARRIEINSVTVISALQACAVSGNLQEGEKIHQLAALKGFELDPSVSTALIDMYMKSFLPEKAAGVFKRMPKKDVVSWVALLSGYTLNGMPSKSVEIFNRMLSDGIRPDAVAVVKILTACSELGILHRALCLHGYVVRSGFDGNIFIEASLIELYSKCGSIDNSLKVFEGVMKRDVVIWSTMIASYGIHGKGRESLKLFNEMINSSEAKPNSFTFLSLLSACSHAGLVEEGIEIFNKMVDEYQREPNSEHFSVVVDLLGRKGELEGAFDFVQKIPFQPGPDVWGALLGACRIHHNVELGEAVAKNLFASDPSHAGYYILLSGIYAGNKKWESVAELRSLVRGKGLKKKMGSSVVEAGSEVHSFAADDRLHPNSQQIHELLQNLEMKMREEGYICNKVLPHDAEEVL